MKEYSLKTLFDLRLMVLTMQSGLGKILRSLDFQNYKKDFLNVHLKECLEYLCFNELLGHFKGFGFSSFEPPQLRPFGLYLFCSLFLNPNSLINFSFCMILYIFSCPRGRVVSKYYKLFQEPKPKMRKQLDLHTPIHSYI
jgi:hypothetical protein